MIWGWGDDKRLGDWGIVDRHRKRARREGFLDGFIVGCIVSVAGGYAASWLIKHYWS